MLGNNALSGGIDEASDPSTKARASGAVQGGEGMDNGKSSGLNMGDENVFSGEYGVLVMNEVGHFGTQHEYTHGTHAPNQKHR